MRFGVKTEIKTENGVTTSKVTKFRDYDEVHNETICEERVQIMKIQDFDTIAAKMHVDHALQDHGCWVEYKGDKMYVIKRWIERT
jgi:hypothetical protein